MSKHTPGPWRVGEWGNGIQPLYTLNIFADASEVTIASEVEQFDAKHIVACVNACEDINPEAVSDLLAASKQLLDGIKLLDLRDTPFCEEFVAGLKSIEAAIAKAKS